MFKKIRTLCIERDISIHELEKLLGFSNGTIRRWERSMPKVDKLKAVADYFDRPIEWFL